MRALESLRTTGESYTTGCDNDDGIVEGTLNISGAGPRATDCALCGVARDKEPRLATDGSSNIAGACNTTCCDNDGTLNNSGALPRGAIG